MWNNKYIGIPYKSGGRNLDGIDCWGLARLIYKNELNIDLPSFENEYLEGDTERVIELMAQYREGWELVEDTQYKTGDLILFRILGGESHVGIITEYPYFIHATRGNLSCIEKLDSVKWQNRQAGIFRYKAQTKNIIHAVPHPLKTQHIKFEVLPGTTLRQAHERLKQEFAIMQIDGLKTIMFVNGQKVPEMCWDREILASDHIEYRVVPGDDSSFRMVLTAIIVIVAMVALQPHMVTIASAIGTSTATATSITLVATSAAASLLVNAIIPIIPPKVTNEGATNNYNVINGNSNPNIPYEPIPIILGKIRMTPPLGMSNFVELDPTESYLRMLLIWGFGPLTITDMRIGNTSIADYEVPENVTLYGTGRETTAQIEAFNSVNSRDIEQQFKDIILEQDTWQEVTFSQLDTGRIEVQLHFPQGLRRQNKSNGTFEYAPFTGDVEFAKVSEDWGSATHPMSTYAARDISFNHTSYSYQLSGDGGSVDGVGYQWTSVYVFPGGSVSTAQGAMSNSPTSNPSYEFYSAYMGSLNRYLGENTPIPSYLPTVPAGARELLRVLMYNDTIQQVNTFNGATYTLIDNDTVHLNSNTIDITGQPTIAIGGPNGQRYGKAKDPFTYTIKIDGLEPGQYKVRVKRTNDGSADAYGDTYYALHECRFLAANAFSRNSRPTIPIVENGVNLPLAKTALRIKATNQLNGSVDGINAVVQTICWDYDNTASPARWVKRATSNPASLFRYVLQHPGNAQRISDADIANQVDLDQLAYWHTYCKNKNFAFNHVYTGVTSVLEVLRHICAAGRASPHLIDGKWTVIIDEPKSTIVQHFSSHNSWGFEGSKPLVKVPDAFRVKYINEAADYTDNEIYVYNKGKNANNAKIIEALDLLGTTNAGQAGKQARWHLAQLNLRPERFKLNTDLEYLVCNKGDKVLIQHDVPMWGVGTGRIVSQPTSTSIVLDNDILLEANVGHVIRIRTSSGTSLSYTLTNVTTTGYYNTLTVTQNLNSSGILPDDLVLVGTTQASFQECLVQSIEPTAAGTATLTLVNYNEAMYSVDTSTEYSLPDYTPNVTRFPEIYIPTITQVPRITRIISDESAMERLTSGTARVRISVAYTNSSTSPLPHRVNRVELQIRLTDPDNTADINWISCPIVQISRGAVYAVDVEERSQYDIRVRYLRDDGVSGPWTAVQTHTVTGRTTPPRSVTLPTTHVNVVAATIRFTWNANPELDVTQYEVRSTNSGWGTSGYTYRGGSTSVSISPPSVLDSAAYSSNGSAILTYISGDLTTSNISVGDILCIGINPNTTTSYYTVLSKNTTTITLDRAVTANIKNTITKAETWFIKAIDSLGNYSTNSTPIYYARPSVSNVTGNITYTFQDTATTNATVTIDWGDVTSTTFGIAGYVVTFVENSITRSRFVQASTITLPANWIGDRAFTIQTKDNANGLSTGVVINISKVAPNPVRNQRAQVIDNNVLLFWDYGPVTTLPATSVKVKRGTIDSSWDTATLIGNKSGEFTTINELVGGTYRYYLAAVDTDGQESTPVTVDARVSAPPDFVFRGELTSAFSSTYISNLYKEKEHSDSTSITSILMPVNTAETWEEHFTSYRINAITVMTPGSNYAVGDIVELNSTATIKAVFKVTSVSSGAVTGIQVIVPGSYTTAPIGTYTTTAIDSDGTGLVVSVTDSSTLTNPSTQLADYPIYIEPNNYLGSYTEVFDFGSIVPSSNIAVTVSNTVISGTPELAIYIYTSDDGVSWSSPVKDDSLFAINFRYVKIKVSVTAKTLHSLMRISDIRVRLSSRAHTEQGNTTLTSNGKIVNFTDNFFDVQSIILTPNTTQAVTTVYDFKDTNYSATYSVTSNVCTVTTTVAHGLVVGQLVRLATSTGALTTGRYTIVTVPTTTSFTVAVTSVNTSGALLAYPNSFKIYAYVSNTGATASMPLNVAYTIRGY